MKAQMPGLYQDCQRYVRTEGMDSEDSGEKRPSSSRPQGKKQAHGAWLPAEDARLRNAVRKHGNRWVTVAAEVGTRNGDQCAKRWSENLNPELDHSPWTLEEEEYLLRLVQTHGHNWKFMAERYLKSRAPLALKNRYSLLMRRMKRQGNARQHVAATASETSNPVMLSGSDGNFSSFADIVPPEYVAANDRWQQSHGLALSALNSGMDNAASSSTPAYNTSAVTCNETDSAASRHRLFSQSLPTSPKLSNWDDSWLSSLQQTSYNSDLELQKEWNAKRSKSFAGTEFIPGSNLPLAHHYEAEGSAMSGVLSSSGQESPPVVEYSLTCQSSKLKRVLDHLVVAAMSEIESSTAEDDQVTVQLTLKA